MKLLEKDIAKQIKDFLQARGWRIVRTQFAATPGMFSTGEPGMCDVLAIRYMPVAAAPARCLACWIEFKGPNDQRQCRCRPGEKKICKVCRQSAWQKREKDQGAMVVVADSLSKFEGDYEFYFGFLHRGEQARGQLELLP